MEVIGVIAAVAVLAVAVGVAIPATRRHRRERHDVENMFSSGPEESVWWERQ